MLRAPLAVRVNDGVTDRHVTLASSGLRYSRTVNGGYESLSVTVRLDPDTFSDLGPSDKIWVYGPDASVLWEGFLDNPGRTAGPEGVGLEVVARGTPALLDDKRQPLVYLDTDLGSWEKYTGNGSPPSANAGVSDDPTGTTTGDGLLVQFNPGQALATGNVAQIGYTAFQRAPGHTLGTIYVVVDSGKTDTAYRTDLAYSAGGVSGSLVIANPGTISTAAVAYESRAGLSSAHPPLGQSGLALRLRRSGGATSVADDNTWAWFSQIAVGARRMDRNGVLGTPGGVVDIRTVLASEVVEDMLGRVLAPLVDVNRSEVQPTTFGIDQLAYPDAVTMGEVLDDLVTVEPDFYYEMLDSAAGVYRFRFAAWPTTARYEISVDGGFDAPGGDVDLCNRIAVRWTDRRGREQVTVVTATSDQYPALSALEDQGRTRDAEAIDLPEGYGSATNAQRIGQQALAQAASLPVAGTAAVRRPIADLSRGGWAMPWELEPGCLVRVRETGELLRCTRVEYDDDAGQATLTLGTPVLTLEQRLARLTRRRGGRRGGRG